MVGKQKLTGKEDIRKMGLNKQGRKATILLPMLFIQTTGNPIYLRKFPYMRAWFRKSTERPTQL